VFGICSSAKWIAWYYLHSDKPFGDLGTLYMRSHEFSTRMISLRDFLSIQIYVFEYDEGLVSVFISDSVSVSV
jgi:hypothetical protein